MSRLPVGDLELEMEEMDGFLNGRDGNDGHQSSSTGRVGSKPAGTTLRENGGAVPHAISKVLRYGGRANAFLLFVVGVVILLLAYNGDDEVQAIEGSAHHGLVDVTTKPSKQTESEHLSLPAWQQMEQAYDRPNVESPNVEHSNVESPKVESPKVNPPQVKPPEVEPPKVEPLKVEPPKIEPPKVEPLKVEPQPTVEASNSEDESKVEKDEKPKAQEENEQKTVESKPEEEKKKDSQDEDRKDSEDEENKGEDTLPKKIDPDRRNKLVEKWGEWHFWDSDEASRPEEDYCDKFPNCDIPEMDFPENSWQVDAVYVNHFIDAAQSLVSRAREAIYTEYGHGKPLESKELAERSKMFKLKHIDLAELTEPPEDMLNGGGWTTSRSFKGLVKRLLHAMMTNDSFTVVMGGSSMNTLGRGNHFLQTYPMQFHRIMEPVFKRLNIKLVTRHMGQENVGSLQSALGSGSIFGEDVDMIIWDSEDADEVERAGFDLLARQALLSEGRVPVIWGGNFDVLKTLHEEVGADVGQHGWGWNGVELTKDDNQVKDLPWAVQYLKCEEGKEALCDKNENKFLTQCWVDRDDVDPPTKQDTHLLDGQDENHPGFRQHQLLGRVLAYTVLSAMQEAISTWSEVTITSGHPLVGDYWHMTDYYSQIREKVKKLDASVGFCRDLKKYVPERLCTTPMKARTQYTPRADPDKTSISSILKPADGYTPKLNEEAVYDGDDVPNPVLDIPEEAIDVFEIVSLGIDQVKEDDKRRLGPFTASFLNGHTVSEDKRVLATGITPGKGWEVSGELPGTCDGTATGTCGRLKSSKCLLSGHMNSKGGILGNEYSGWLVMNILDVKEGIIVLKLETEHKSEESIVTDGWTTVDDEKRRLGGSYSSRSVLSDDFVFEYSIDGKITLLKKDEFVEFLTVLDDSAVNKDNVEVGIRLRGCGRECTFSLTHVYWA